ncbi:MAG: thiamine pyrophosphate-binding protein [Rhodospirillaceae bacterium]|nr:thiamine pyrophosphate-binding protein [Rhodospirillaceae bacterium]MBT5565888.1 thiamine pyrophosphate-binding protein [Rhodospirillaceae bacterium]MBT6088692.1 thiamine pyrophosphate-binding protein [Rhodospirillaceae bacterium]
MAGQKKRKAKSKTNRMNGGEVIATALAGYGVCTVACLSGTAHTHLLFAFENHDIEIVSGRHETATVAVADGYARIAGRLGVALIKADQGLPNAMSGIITANQACSPVVVLVSMLPDPKREAADEWPNDWLDMVKPYAKWVRSVPSADRLEEFVHAAARHALTGRPGVAVLGIPQHFEGQAVDAAKFYAPVVTDPPAPSLDSIERAADILAKAKRPMVLAGSGAALSGAGPALRKFAKAFDVPVLANALGRGLVPEDMTLGFSWPLAQVAAKDADVVVVVGMRLTERMGYGLAPRFNGKAKFIQIDVEAEEIGRNRIVDAPVCGDARLSVEALHKALKKRKVVSKGSPTWVNKALKVRLARIEELGKDATGPIHPYRIGRDLMALMPSDAVYVGDGADVQNWMHAILRIRSDRGFMDHYPLGSMGIGTPLAIGAAAAARDLARENGTKARPVVLVTGDGAFGFYAAEFNAAALAGLKIICVISNDGAWGTEKHGQLNAVGKSINCELGQWDYHLIGQMFGGHGEKVESPNDVKPALKRAFAADTFSVINVLTDPMAGLVRKQDPRVQTVAFEDLVSSLKTHHTPDVA